MNKLPEDIFGGEENNESVIQFLETNSTGYEYFEEADIHALIRPREVAAHKAVFGHALIIAGSEGKIGAAILTAKAALRTGCGLLTAWVPSNAVIPLLSALPEAMTMVRDDSAQINIPSLERFNAIGFGPGVGMQAGNSLWQLLENYPHPLVIDADGLTLLSQHRDTYQLLSPHMILTPHPGEFDRLTRSHVSVFERCKTQLAFSKQYHVTVLLKGRHTSITTPEGKIYFNATGNNGMATAGSGDVLTGIITSLLAQGYTTETAAVTGAYLHGYAGDRAAERVSKSSMIASDIIEGISSFFLAFEK